MERDQVKIDAIVRAKNALRVELRAKSWEEKVLVSKRLSVASREIRAVDDGNLKTK